MAVPIRVHQLALCGGLALCFPKFAVAAEVGENCKTSYQAYEVVKKERPSEPASMNVLREAAKRVSEGKQSRFSKADDAILCSPEIIRYNEQKKDWSKRVVELGDIALGECAEEIELHSKDQLELRASSIAFKIFLVTGKFEIDVYRAGGGKQPTRKTSRL